MNECIRNMQYVLKLLDHLVKKEIPPERDIEYIIEEFLPEHLKGVRWKDIDPYLTLNYFLEQLRNPEPEDKFVSSRWEEYYGRMAGEQLRRTLIHMQELIETIFNTAKIANKIQGRLWILPPNGETYFERYP